LTRNRLARRLAPRFPNTHIDIRDYVDAVKKIAASETTPISADTIERWSKWALAEADRIDPVRSARFLNTFDAKDDAN
jgi:hypothetical protein